MAGTNSSTLSAIRRRRCGAQSARITSENSFEAISFQQRLMISMSVLCSVGFKSVLDTNKSFPASGRSLKLTCCRDYKVVSGAILLGEVEANIRVPNKIWTLILRTDFFVNADSRIPSSFDCLHSKNCCDEKALACEKKV